MIAVCVFMVSLLTPPLLILTTNYFNEIWISFYSFGKTNFTASSIYYSVISSNSPYKYILFKGFFFSFSTMFFVISCLDMNLHVNNGLLFDYIIFSFVYSMIGNISISEL